ncbi:MAG: helix-turn-helix transcriptional regulator [Candidatus Omnitrophica bacterium]|nr:helix-turn-helix transcriptional regulator [Candidatus Omnitrophota bacterium]
MEHINISSDPAVLNQIGKRMARYRLNKNMKQSELAQEAGVSIATVQRAESGESIQLLKLIRIMRALNLMENINALIPEVPVSPLQQMKHQGRVRQRASSYGKQKNIDEWFWGDDK